MSIKTILAGTAAAAALVLTGGIAYATTGSGPASPAPAVTPAVTTTATTQPAAQNPATWPAATCPRHGNDCCPGTGNSRTATRPAAVTPTRPATSNGYGYQGSSHYNWGNGSWCCGGCR